MRVAVTGATGLIGRRLVTALKDRGDEVTVLSRDPARARATLGVETFQWSPEASPPPREAVAGRDVIVHLAGAPVAQRWSGRARRAILASREEGTRNLVAALASATPRPAALVSSSAVGFYGDRDQEILDDTEAIAAGNGFLAGVCVAWELEAQAAEQAGLRVARIRTGVVLDPEGGALAKMLPFFKLGIGGPVAGGRQRIPWIHVDDLVRLYLRASDDQSWSGAFNATAPAPPTNAEFSKALGRVLHRPAFLPVPAFAIRILYGRMSQIVTDSQRAVPARALAADFRFTHPELGPALRDVLTRKP